MKISYSVRNVLTFYFFISIFNFCFAQNWQLVWSDEFNEQSIDGSNWTKEIGGNGWGNNELQYYTDRDTNAYIDNGYLVIQALKENYSSWQYTSARLKSQTKRFFKYGKVVARIKLPYSQGIWPAFWMMGESLPFLGWPNCGEIDIVELIGGVNNDNTVYGTAHWGDENGNHAQYGNSYSLSSGIFADNFHLFSIEWDEQQIKWFVDNHLYVTLDITPPTLSEFHDDFFILLNVAVGGSWPGYPDSTSVFPQKMIVDYVRVYQDNPNGVEEGSNIPSDFNLYQNFPNPFNPNTKITYELPVQSDVKINIYNLLGEKIQAYNFDALNAGMHSINFNATGLSSGVYVYEIYANSSGNYSEYFSSKKMLYLQ